MKQTILFITLIFFLLLSCIGDITNPEKIIQCPGMTSSETEYGCPGSAEYKKKKKDCVIYNMMTASIFGQCSSGLSNCRNQTYVWMNLMCAAGCPGTEGCF